MGPITTLISGSRARRVVKVGLIHLAVTAMMLMVAAQAAQAATWYLPDLTSNGKFNYMTISRFGRIPQADGGYITPTLNAPASYAKLAYDRVPDSVTFYDGGYCNNSDIDTNVHMSCGSTNDKYQVHYDFQALNYETGELGPVKRFTSSQMPVKGFYSANLRDLQGTAPSADGKYFVQMYAHWAYENPSYCNVGNPPPCYGGFNSFLIVMPRNTDLATYPATNASAPPLATYAKGPNADEFSDITFEFAPKCFATGEALKRPLIWEDADFGERNQEGPISWELWDDTTGRRIDRRSNAQLGGQNERVARNVDFKMNHKYRWIWRNVDEGNGVNFILPFDGYNYYRECPSVVPPPPPPPPPPPVYIQPYFNVTGGDVSVGQGMSVNNADCGSADAVPRNTLAGIAAWNRGPDNSYTGAGAQYATYVLNRLQEFSTAQGGTIRPNGLSFANMTGNPADTDAATGYYGGKYNGGSCTSSYFDTEASLPAGNKRLTELLPASAAGGNIPNGEKLKYYIDGDLFVDSNVRFSGSYPSLSDIPSFTAVVRGNIYIDKAVTQLDGVYVAEPANNTEDKGNLYTCANANGSNFAAIPLTAQLHANCNTNLVINGAVSAKRFWPLRTAGDVAAGPAETINYVPELWMGSNVITGVGGGKYDAITGLPPVL